MIAGFIIKNHYNDLRCWVDFTLIFSTMIVYLRFHQASALRSCGGLSNERLSRAVCMHVVLNCVLWNVDQASWLC